MNQATKLWMAFVFSMLALFLAPSIALAQSSQFFAMDSDEIIATSENMLLRHDLRTGHLAITFMDGHRVEFNLQPSKLPDQELSTPVLNFHSGGPYYGREQDGQIQGNCTAEANTLQSAINGVQSACGNDSGSDTCTDAISFYQSASAAYTLCIFRVFYEMN